LREVGAVLGASEDAAQKRVTRTLEQLRGFFVKQGVPVSAAGLAAHLSTNAVEAAPAALSGFIAAASGSFAASMPAVALGTSPAIAMTMLQKSLLAAAVVVLGVGVYEVRGLADQGEHLAALEREVAGLAAREAAARAARDAAQRRLAVIDATSAPAVAPVNSADSSTISSLADRANWLKQQFAANPAQRIPELGLVTEEDWVQVARERTVDTEADRRASLARVRSLVKTRFVPQIGQALRAYLRTNPGSIPGKAGELLPFFAPSSMAPDLNATLNRYEITPTSSGGVLISENRAAMPDRDYDYQTRILIAHPYPPSRIRGKIRADDHVYGHGEPGIARAHAHAVSPLNGNRKTPCVPRSAFLELRFVSRSLSALGCMCCASGPSNARECWN
jgi:hypothetical protein